ncbi:hypothetical protein DY000_02063187 [Brassica cretica]|uniref:AP2/ERF domain-containing protein n=1 Tax=Brassica cretica TaxID=69181 RepID=A0ABQ7ATN3_BRACR|nr:hypothetical protein DY000_02063187 [Brassica cretica]
MLPPRIQGLLLRHEEVVVAYDRAAIRLKGHNAQTNFLTLPPPPSSRERWLSIYKRFTAAIRGTRASVLRRLFFDSTSKRKQSIRRTWRGNQSIWWQR